MGRETSLKEWRDRLSEDYSNDSIRRLYYKHNGTMKGLADILIKLMKKHPRNSIYKRGKTRLFSEDNKSYKRESKKNEAYKKEQEEKGKIVIFLYGDEMKFDNFFKKEIHKYFTDKGIKELTFQKLEIILKDYYFEYRKIEKFQELIKKDSNLEREQEIKKRLEQANEILEILESDLYNTLPKEVKIKTIGEQNKETIKKLEELNLQKAYPYSKLFKDLRNI